jgi:hypothetical protein
MSNPITRPDGVLAKHVRPGDRIRFDGRRRRVWRARSTGSGMVTIDMHGVYLRLPEDHRLTVVAAGTQPQGRDELLAA